jgi:hypothetical protein
LVGEEGLSELPAEIPTLESTAEAGSTGNPEIEPFSEITMDEADSNGTGSYGEGVEKGEDETDEMDAVAGADRER